MTAARKLVSVVSVNFRQPEVTCDMLAALAKCSYDAVEVILVDNGSLSDEEQRWRAHYPGRLVHVRSKANLGFAGGTNLGIKHAQGAYILMLNNDTLPAADFLGHLVDLLDRYADVGMVSPRLIFADPPGTLQYAGALLNQPMLGRGTKIGHMEPDDGRYRDTRETQLPHGACMLVRREVFERVGPLPEFYFMYFEEHDFALRAAKLGYRTFYCGRSAVVHRQSVSMGVGSPRKTYYLHRNRLVFYRRALSRGAYLGFLLYYLVLGLPLNAVRYLRARRLDHVRAMLRALGWNARYVGRRVPGEFATTVQRQSDHS